MQLAQAEAVGEFGEDEERIDEKINVLDAFGGIGGNMIQFAKRGYCVGIDNDPVKVNFMRHNARVYDLEELKDF